MFKVENQTEKIAPNSNFLFCQNEYLTLMKRKYYLVLDLILTNTCFTLENSSTNWINRQINLRTWSSLFSVIILD